MVSVQQQKMRAVQMSLSEVALTLFFFSFLSSFSLGAGGLIAPYLGTPSNPNIQKSRRGGPLFSIGTPKVMPLTLRGVWHCYPSTAARVGADKVLAVCDACLGPEVPLFRAAHVFASWSCPMYGFLLRTSARRINDAPRSAESQAWRRASGGSRGGIQPAPSES